MHCNRATFSKEEIDGFLLADGYEPDTEVYFAERRRRYEIDTEASSSTDNPRWVERDDWDPSEPSVTPVYSSEEVERIIQRIEEHEPGSVDSWNARNRLFEPCGADLKDDRWVKRQSCKTSSYSSSISSRSEQRVVA